MHECAEHTVLRPASDDTGVDQMKESVGSSTGGVRNEHETQPTVRETALNTHGYSCNTEAELSGPSRRAGGG
jgi:hypothetical protein